ncbi:MAG: hypothetical protein NVSMB42_11840 [Herpetosiphon sp.]
MRRSGYLLSLLAALVVLLVPAVTSAQADRRCFDETGKCIAGVIRTYWEQNGGLPVFGFPITDQQTETNAEGFTGPTQWFERDRLEDHTGEGKGVLAGLLGVQKLALEGRPWEQLPKVNGGATGCLFFQETGHSLCPPFRAYWEQRGGLARFGYPVSEPITERNEAGFTGNFQWFQRRRMEVHPENQPPFDILLGLLGNEVRSAPRRGGGGGGGGGGGTKPDPCANIEAPVRMVRQPENGCVHRGEHLYFGVHGYEPGTKLGFFITAENGDTIGTANTFPASDPQVTVVDIDTNNYFGIRIPPGNYRAVIQDNENRYLPSYANFRVLP